MNREAQTLLDTLFPFHFVINGDGVIVRTGASMAKVLPDCVGVKLFDVFNVLRPRADSLADVRSNFGQLTLLGIRHTERQMRGQFAELSAGEFAFVGSPRIVDNTSIWSWPVGLADFAPHDGSADYAMVIEAMNTQLQDFERMVAKLTEQERVQRGLRVRAEEANTAKSHFLANISHEIRTPMTAILGFAELLGDEGVDAAERSEYIETIRRNGDHLLAIINDILDLAKIEAGGCTLDIAEVVVPDIVRDVVQLLHMRAVAKGISLVKEVQGDAAMLPIRSDAVRIRQVLLNLVGNAVKFTDQGSVRVVVSAQRSGSRVETRIAVHDTGCGMSEETIPKLFEPFSQFDTSYTRKHGGTGLGLAISRPLAVLLGGRIDVASELGRGSVFTLIFESEVAEPALVFPLPTPSTPAPRSANGPLSGKNILLVEDSIDSQRILSALMSLAGARVDIASDGLSAVARFDGVYCPDLVIMDVQMPGIDGIEATERIRSRGFRGRIVALTAAALSVERDRALNAGCEGFYLKPISRADLLAICVGNQAALD